MFFAQAADLKQSLPLNFAKTVFYGIMYKISFLLRKNIKGKCNEKVVKTVYMDWNYVPAFGTRPDRV